MQRFFRLEKFGRFFEKNRHLHWGGAFHIHIWIIYPFYGILNKYFVKH